MMPRVLALDLEGTLIDDALSGRPRPGLRAFLDYCQATFDHVAIYTAVHTADARQVLADLASAGHVPPSLIVRLEYIDWSGEHKDLRFVPGVEPGDVLLVDDDAGWIRRDQHDRWVPIAGWDGGPDAELERVRAVLDGRSSDH